MKKHSRTFLMYVIIRLIIGILFILNVVGIFIVKDDSQQSRLVFNAIQSCLILIATTLPPLIERQTKFNIPDFMEVIFVVMCVMHFVFGEIGSFYIKFNWWDAMLHTLSGSMIAIVGFSIIESFNRNHDEVNLSPFFVTLFAICFSVTIGVVWEFVEFSSDALLGTNMQRYMNSVTFEPFLGHNALIDTMKDLLLDTIGAITLSVFGYINLKKEKLVFRNWMFTKLQIEENNINIS